ncbi:hypothetical protein ATB99_01485 [Elizabethkingia meningoseptica]|uniref:hypothetical protein n=1 Tax=Elizabethkingia meningoseptica TaxID=238 RepID=UPI000382715B|nr:hypothetical protein [Elizabethkingia meningoseptica]AQX05488.1 hypothetical protein BBD33_09630 [Elizabethkingia meningoseptica]AQX47532.1 hypothetical protein B5G46_09620 [Elizabethkingia meningoseptica]KUY24202.1 hypothetical protein ATB99_01485 [Elizabethkingia meningoseptica]MDE5489617.1 hypothetical protein [Elizabethkingia meningoseptica]MVW91516.1 hypothetical protein [Elizabethkingia meningoseptica]
MKKIITIVALAFTSLTFAKNIKNEEMLNVSLRVETWIKIYSEIEKIVLVLTNYAYLYQTTCGKTFGIVLNKPIWELTANEREDLNDKLVAKNHELCDGYTIPNYEV